MHPRKPGSTRVCRRIPARESTDQFLAMLRASLLQIIRHADIQNRVALVRQDVNEKLSPHDCEIASSACGLLAMTAFSPDMASVVLQVPRGDLLPCRPPHAVVPLRVIEKLP